MDVCKYFGTIALPNILALTLIPHKSVRAFHCLIHATMEIVYHESPHTQKATMGQLSCLKLGGI